MDGQIGVLKQDDRQVGGIYGWEVSLSYDSAVSKGWTNLKVIKYITAQSYWLTEIPKDNIYDMELYKKVDSQLVLMDAGVVKLNLPDTETLNQRLYAPIELNWRQPSEY